MSHTIIPENSSVPDLSTLVEFSEVKDNTTIGDDCGLLDNCTVGNNVTVGDRCQVGIGCTVGDDCTFGKWGDLFSGTDFTHGKRLTIGGLKIYRMLSLSISNNSLSSPCVMIHSHGIAVRDNGFVGTLDQYCVNRRQFHDATTAVVVRAAATALFEDVKRTNDTNGW